MSVPLDRLYHYIESVAKQVYGDVVIYRFWPHGSKKLEDLRILKDLDYHSRATLPPLVCHDQEPLNYDFYQDYELPYYAIKLHHKYSCYKPINLRPFATIFDQTIIVHSEQRSQNLDKYSVNRFIPVYYWSHAVIARDWYRFAKYLTQQKQEKRTFLIYNRAWAGTREYRIKFAEFLVDHNLVDQCQTTFNCTDPDTQIHYQNHVFQNKVWNSQRQLENYFCPNTASSNSSADFNFDDYQSTQVEVVLETLFDDDRLHLTEKILRPIACAQPFVLVATHGSLKYLQDYGFKTYSTIWDESYDQIQDPYQRLQAIVDTMKEIANWDSDTRVQKLAQAGDIAEYNKKYFFSKDFSNLVESELAFNLKNSIKQLVSTNTSSRYILRRKEIAQYPEIRNLITGRSEYVDKLPAEHQKEFYINTQDLMKVLTSARGYYSRQNNPCDQDKNK